MVDSTAQTTLWLMRNPAYEVMESRVNSYNIRWDIAQLESTEKILAHQNNTELCSADN